MTDLTPRYDEAGGIALRGREDLLAAKVVDSIQLLILRRRIIVSILPRRGLELILVFAFLPMQGKTTLHSLLRSDAL